MADAFQKSLKTPTAGLAEVKIVGVEDIIKRLTQFENSVIRKIERKAVRAAGHPVLATAKRLAPIADEYDVHDKEHQPGTLRKSLRLRALKSTRGRRRAGLYGVRVQAGKESHMFKGEEFYGGFVEFGTEHQLAQLFMAAATTENEARSREIFRAQIARYVNEEGAKRG